MSKASEARDEKAKKAFRKQMILTLAEVVALVHGSVSTARRRLKEWQTLTSYNQNGRYYTLPDVPEFDANGLWQKCGVLFSQYGNLKQTVVELVRRSSAGLNAGDIRSLLGVEPRSFLSSLATHPQLRREKVNGRFVYYAADEALYNTQRQRRGALKAKGRQVTPAEAIAILVAKIKHPSLSNEELSRQLEKHKVSVEPEIIYDFFLRHDLAEKKTPRSV